MVTRTHKLKQVIWSSLYDHQSRAKCFTHAVVSDNRLFYWPWFCNCWVPFVRTTMKLLVLTAVLTCIVLFLKNSQNWILHEYFQSVFSPYSETECLCTTSTHIILYLYDIGTSYIISVYKKMASGSFYCKWICCLLLVHLAWKFHTMWRACAVFKWCQKNKKLKVRPACNYLLTCCTELIKREIKCEIFSCPN